MSRVELDNDDLAGVDSEGRACCGGENADELNDVEDIGVAPRPLLGRVLGEGRE